MSADDEVQCYIVSANIDGQDVPVQLYRRMDAYSILRQVDPCDPTPEPVPVYAGDEEPVVMQAVMYASHHLYESGNDGFLFSTRVVPDRVDGDTVYARSLRRGESDDGRRVHVPPGGQLSFDEGALVVELEAIEDFERQGREGPLPLTPVLWTWMRFGSGASQVEELYLLSAARRHDIALDLLAQICDDLDFLPESEAAPVHRQVSFRLISRVESLCIALGRLVTMIERAGTVLSANSVAQQSVPPEILNHAPAVKAIRDAFEHIDERAQGLRQWKKPDPDALTIFKHSKLLSDETVSYGHHSLTLGEDVPVLLSNCRDFLKRVAGH